MLNNTKIILKIIKKIILLYSKMKQKSVISSFWFWLLIVGILLILIAAMLSGGLREVNGWIWGIFIAGVIFSILGVIFALISWSKTINTDSSHKSENIHSSYSSPSYSSPSYSSPSYSSPSCSSSNYNSPIPSPIGTPTPVNYNIPQAHRGFASTNLNLSSLAP